MRRRRITYEAIQHLNGDRVSEEEALERLVTDYFSNLFTDNTNYLPYGVRRTFPKLLEFKIKCFEGEVTNKEIRKILFSMGNYKAPCMDYL